MILQSIVYPDEICPKDTVYFQGNATLKNNKSGLILEANEKVSFYSYMNGFDINFWKEYTTVANVQLTVRIKGSGVIKLKCQCDDKEQTIAQKRFVIDIEKSAEEIELSFCINDYSGIGYFEVYTEKLVVIESAHYVSDEMQNTDVNIALNICTYKREQWLERNIECLKQSSFWINKTDYYKKLNVVIVDNASQISIDEEPQILLVHNPNEGGSGGFTRGISEIKKINTASHVVFMDDDVVFNIESIYRLYAVLSFIKEEYRNVPIAGRMFRLDAPWIQYTAAEIWDSGNIRHIGHNVDMTDFKNVYDMNTNFNAEYGGWWFSCYPYEFVKENVPLPFFLHCDDVEYGLRCKEIPIVLNGIQVWHETYEYRNKPIIYYYDTRNPLIVNEKYNLQSSDDKVYKEWKQKISYFHIKQEYLYERMIILGFIDYCKGERWFNCVDGAKLHKKLSKIEKASKIGNAIMWRIAAVKFKFRKKYRKVK